MAETIRIKAAKDAPDAIAHGNLYAEKKGGHYTTEHRRFADHIVNQGFGEEVDTINNETSELQPEKETRKTGGKK